MLIINNKHNERLNYMNKLTKIGLSALAGSLVAVSAHAGSLSASGSASMSFANGDVDEKAAGATGTTGNQWTMADSITMTGGGDMDNGMSVSVSFEIDNDEADAGEVLDSHSITLDTNGMGTITFAGHGGGGFLDSNDDKSPNAYEESWDGVTNADEETLVGGVTANNMFVYNSPDMGNGTTVTVSYVPSGDAANTPNESYMDFGVTSTGLMDGLTVGFGMGTEETTVGTELDHQVAFATYSYGGITVGGNINEIEGTAASNDIEFSSLGITYAVSDEFSIGYNTSTSDNAAQAQDQEATGISASYTSGGLSVGGMINTVDNVAYAASSDTEGYELNIAFAF